ncbi:beta-glucoside-specific phosphotransferase system enzyme II [Gordonia hirsuta DSM 44140 = NBRC 16056]|uniref:Beta-glucoside-specific phosphotransferase system enzyme II n=1 Tax=Gordonia hirsuta DSM 44140 = NBRC 16056 TaxID=1121927 RepID=L7LAT0_9ACTN|nr:glucose PTS transporter subunit IIA [Gordonia hirsuta]GAC58250.1 beta-glucoside-specific phosphotransferase system enzyme II [Gordonia hirsuta DSM 44140 = NBRC 16056]
MSEKDAQAIVDALGGPGNITHLTHCATRLRFEVHDTAGIDKDTVEAIPVVLGAVPQGATHYQVVIGGGVQDVFNDIMALPAMKDAGGSDADAVKAAARAQGPRGKVAWIDSLFEFLSDSFRPVLGALLGASLFITFMALMATLEVIPAWNDPTAPALSPSWSFVNLAWQCVFVFLPLMIAYNAAQKVGADPWVGFAVMAVLMLPGYMALGDEATERTLFGFDIKTIDVFGLPLTINDYGSQVFPPLLMAALLGPLYKLLKKLIPANVHLVFVPFLAMLIMIPLTAFLIGPIGVYAGAGLGSALKSINDFSPLIFAIVIPLAYPFMVPLGLHWPINAIMLVNIKTLGYDFIQGPMGAWNFACFGATAGVLVLAWRQRDIQMRQTATGALTAGLLGGISEPSLYGIHLRFKRIYPRMLVGCFVGGLIIGIGGGVKTTAFVFTSLLTIPAFSNMYLYMIAVAAAFFTAMFLIIVSGFRSPEQQADFEAIRAADEAAAAVAEEAPDAAAPAEEVAEVTVAAAPAQPGAGAAAGAVAVAEVEAPARGPISEICSPVSGIVLPLEEVPDPAFAAGSVGHGVAIDPTGDTVFAPANATVVAMQPTGHAVGMVLDGGIELLIHIGIDTVQMAGEGFTVHVEAGQKVRAGTALVTFDREKIEAAGYSPVTPVVVMNTKKFLSVTGVAEGLSPVGTPIIAVESKPFTPKTG